MTQLSLKLPVTNAISLYTRIGGKLARWDTFAGTTDEAIFALRQELRQEKVPHGVVLALLRPQGFGVPTNDTSEQCYNTSTYGNPLPDGPDAA